MEFPLVNCIHSMLCSRSFAFGGYNPFSLQGSVVSISCTLVSTVKARSASKEVIFCLLSEKRGKPKRRRSHCFGEGEWSGQGPP